MRLCEIMEKLDNYAITVLEGKNLETDITGIRMITKDQTVFLSNILYFGSISQLPEVSQNGYCVNFLCYGSLTELTGILDSGVDVNCLLISSREDAFAIYNQIQDIFLESEQVVTGMRAFLDALFEVRVCRAFVMWPMGFWEIHCLLWTTVISILPFLLEPWRTASSWRKRR